MQIEHKPLTLGEVLDGDRMAKSQYELKFKGLYTSDPSFTEEKCSECRFNFLSAKVVSHVLEVYLDLTPVSSCEGVSLDR